MSAAALMLLGALVNPAERTFRVEQVYEVKPSADVQRVTVLLPVPKDDPWQTVTGLSIDGAPFEIVFDPAYGNEAARVELPPSGGTLKMSYTIARRERGVSCAGATGKAAPSGYARWLRDDALVKV